MTTLDRLKNTVLHVVAGWVLPVLRGVLQNGFRQHAGLPVQWLESQNPYGRTELALVGVIPGFEPPHAYPAMNQSTGHFLPRSSPISNDREKAVADWLATPSARPLVYISIGTNSDHTSATANSILKVLVDGAVKGSRFRALWSLKDKHKHLLDPELLAQLDNSQEKNILISPFVHQLLALENAAVFLSHCGLSSAQESLFFGVPLLCFPMMLDADQPTIAARVVELGLGLWLDRRTKELTPDDLTKALNALLAPGNSAAKEAQRFKAVTQKLNGLSTAANWLEAAMDPVDIAQLLQPLPACNWDVSAVVVGAFVVALLLLRALLRICCCRRRANSRATKHKKH